MVVDPNDVFVPLGATESNFKPLSSPKRGKLLVVDRPTAWEPSEVEINQIQELVRSHKGILSQTTFSQPFSKVAQFTILGFSQVICGTFKMAYNWDGAWKKRARPECVELPRTFPEVLEALETSLKNLEATLPQGYHYPPIKNGKRVRVSLRDFMTTAIPGKPSYSPWLELLSKFPSSDTLSNTLSQLKSELPNRPIQIAEAIRKTAQEKAGAPWGKNADKMFWGGVKNLYEWFDIRKPELLNLSPSSRLIFGSFTTLLRVIEDYQAGGGWIPFGFVCPQNSVWSDFLFWLQRSRGVKIPPTISV